MTALSQGSAGLALVMGFALLVTRQVSTAAILLAVQSGAVALAAVLLHQPLLAIPPLILAGGAWLVRHDTPDPRTAPAGGAKLGIAVGTVLAILCQTLGVLALPSAIILLSVLLAATRPHRLMQTMALVAMQNGVVLAGSLVSPAEILPAALLFPIACVALPLPLAAGLLIPAIVPWRFTRTAAWFGWIDLGLALTILALALLAATLVVPLTSLAAVFAPLLALDGVLRSIVRRGRPTMSAARRGAALAQTGFTVLAVCAPNLVTAWLAVLAAITMALLPRLSRRWDAAILAFLAAGLSLFGILLLPVAPPMIGWFSLFAGFATIAAIVPDVAVVLVILILRLADQMPWPPGIESLGIGIAVIALLACALLLANPVRSRRVSLLLLAQASIAALTICSGTADGRFAALVLLILLVLTRAAARITDGFAASLALAGLAGVPPLGVFPGLILVVLAWSANDPWILLPLGVALIPIVLAGRPRQLPDFALRLAIPSIGWLPLLLATLAGYAAPDSLVHWWHILTAGRT
jgi:hypothetical protein